MPEKKREQRNIQSIERAVTILDYLQNKPDGERLTTIAFELGLNKSTAFGIISTLENMGLLHQNSQTGRYMLGLKFLSYGNSLKSSLRLPDVARSSLKRLSERFEENVHLATLDAGSVLYLDTVESSKAMQIVVRIGGRAPFYSTSLGKVLTAFLPKEKQDALLEATDMVPRTEFTICDKDAFRAELSKIRKLGYASERDEGEVGISCIAAPIHNHDGVVVAAISIAQPTARLEQRDQREIIRAVLESAEEISERCGDLNIF